MLPTTGKMCCAIIRLEDGFLNKMLGLLKEYFGNRSGYLPEGSMLMFGSISHLANRGLESYAEEAVKTHKVFSSLLPRMCSITHLVFAPLGGMNSEGLIRDLYDLDCWLRSARNTNAASLPEARAMLWRTLCSENAENLSASGSDRTVFMPESLLNSAKTKVYSAAPAGGLPERIKPLSGSGERVLIYMLLKELIEPFTMDLEPEPILKRCTGNHDTEKNAHTGRIVIIGASHVFRLVGGLGSLRRDIVNLSRPGWQADKAATAELAEKLLKLNITAEDVIIIDPLSNTFFCGSDNEGDPTEPVKLSDGKWHIMGDLSCRHRTKLKRVLDELSKAIECQSSPLVVIVTPVPRYLLAKCCADPDHITNFADRLYISEIEKELDSVEDLLVDWGQSLTSRSDILNFRAVADD
jgi:hypothetical protein